VIGRTSWDKAHCWAINSQAEYHFCNETLRDEFYQYKWELSKCEKHSIFLSQAHYPIKGLQQLIMALPIILKFFPDTKVYVGGNNFITNRGWRLNGYGNYINSLMKKNHTAKNFIFTGILPEKEMCQRYLLSNLFICPSSIENSPNSIGEAQLLGVPCVAANVGGISDMIRHEETGLLYRFEEIEMLAYSVCRLFSDSTLVNLISLNSKSIASKRHNKIENSTKLYEIYTEVCNQQ
ncbi:MAG: glycosyltransferase family 4 protein, partial [Paludibacter sp.]